MSYDSCMINQAQRKIYLQYLTDDRFDPACLLSGTHIDTYRHMVDCHLQHRSARSGDSAIFTIL